MLTSNACLPLILEIQKAVWAVKISPRPKGRNETMTVVWSSTICLYKQFLSFLKNIYCWRIIYVLPSPPFYPIDLLQPASSLPSTLRPLLPYCAPSLHYSIVCALGLCMYAYKFYGWFLPTHPTTSSFSRFSLSLQTYIALIFVFLLAPFNSFIFF